MTIKKYNIQDIKEAYIKLKSYIYYDKNLFYKDKIATFEKSNDLTSKFNEILEIIYDNNYKKRLGEYLKLIDFYVLPKKIKGANIDNSKIVTNKSISDKYIINDVNYFIDLPVELQIIDTLWCMTVGVRFQKKINTSILYANMLDIDNKGKFRSNNLYKKYFTQYAAWRDNAINEVEKLYTNKKQNSIIFSLDIKKYYYSINLNYKKLNKYPQNIVLNRLTNILELIHNKYREKIKYYLSSEIKTNKFLPIGLLSSGIIANWYLSDLDNYIVKKLSPVYYGRYVDDILLVFSADNEIPSINSDKDLLEKYFVTSKLFKINEDDLVIALRKYSNLKIQQNKIKSFIIDKFSSKHIIEKFKSDIQANSSEFRFLPSVNELDKEYALKLFTLNYDGSSNILRNIENFKLNKYNMSVYLAKKIKMSFYIQKKFEDDFLLEALDNIIQGSYLLELYPNWFKIFEYLLITQNNNKFKALYVDIQNKYIKRVFYHNEFIKDKWRMSIQNKLRTHIQNYLNIAITLAFSLNPNKIFKFNNANNKKLLESVKSYRISNFIDNNRIFIPLYNYSKQFKKETENANTLKELRNLLEYNYNNMNKETYVLDEDLLKYSPINIYDSKKELNRIIGNILFNDCKDLSTYTKLDPQNSHIIIGPKDYVSTSSRQINIFDIDFQDSSSKLEKIKIGIVNKLISIEEAEQLNNYKITDESYENIRNLLEEAKAKKCNLLLFPELAIPIELLPLLYNEVRAKKVGIISGLKHFANNNKCMYNFLCTILPFKYKNLYNDSFITLRIKNNYSPAEQNSINSAGYKVPNIDKHYYDLIHWRGLYFSSYNCFEISSIEDRGLFKGSVDFVTVHAFNKDVEYFNNILKSTARDIHCCVIQVNNSNYGYSAVALPKETYEALPVIVKGSEDDIIMTYTFDYKDLRKFQNEYQKGVFKNKDKDKDKMKYKHLPPNFEISEGRKKYE